MTDYRNFPPNVEAITNYSGWYPTDFLLETVLDAGLLWFRNTTEAPLAVYGQLLRPELSHRYGQNKIDEIATYIKAHDIRIIQSFPTDDTQYPVVSINLQEGHEDVTMAGLGTHQGLNDVLTTDGAIVSRNEVGYTPFSDSILIGIHAAGSPDKVKYLFYLVNYILASSRRQLEALGLFNMTTRATDLSRLNEFLPQNVFSRFVTVTLTSTASFNLDDVPIIDHVNVNTTFGG